MLHCNNGNKLNNMCCSMALVTRNVSCGISYASNDVRVHIMLLVSQPHDSVANSSERLVLTYCRSSRVSIHTKTSVCG